MVAIQVINIDYSMQKVGGNTPSPVIRVFGSSAKSLHRYCVNIHGVYPYLYFRPDDINDSTFDSKDIVESYLPYIMTVLEELAQTHKAQVQLEARRRVNPSAGLATSSSGSGSRGPKVPIIVKLEVVTRRSIYGYFPNEVPFIKVYLHNPASVKLIVHILENGLLGGVIMQPYEAHIPYLLQFTTDYNVAPMGWLHFESAVVRSDGRPRNVPVPQAKDDCDTTISTSVPVAAPAPAAIHEEHVFLSPMHVDTTADPTSSSYVSHSFDEIHCTELEHLSSRAAAAEVMREHQQQAATPDAVSYDCRRFSNSSSVGLDEASPVEDTSLSYGGAREACATPEGDNSFLHELLDGISKSQFDWSVANSQRSAENGHLLGPVDEATTPHVPIEVGVVATGTAGNAADNGDARVQPDQVSYHEEWKKLLRRRVSALPAVGTRKPDPSAPAVSVSAAGDAPVEDIPADVSVDDWDTVYQPALVETVDARGDVVGAAAGGHGHGKWAGFPLLLKSTSCEVEIDIQAEDIENVKHAHTEFGAELLARPEFQQPAFQDLLAKAKESAGARPELVTTVLPGEARVMHLPGASESLAQADFRGRAVRLIEKGGLMIELQDALESDSEYDREGECESGRFSDSGGVGYVDDKVLSGPDGGAGSLNGISVHCLNDYPLHAVRSHHQSPAATPASQASTVVDSQASQDNDHAAAHSSLSQAAALPPPGSLYSSQHLHSMALSPGQGPDSDLLSQWARAANRQPCSQRQMPLFSQQAAGTHSQIHARYGNRGRGRHGPSLMAEDRVGHTSSFFASQISQQCSALSPEADSAMGFAGSLWMPAANDEGTLTQRGVVAGSGRVGSGGVDEDRYYDEYMSVFSKPKQQDLSTVRARASTGGSAADTTPTGDSILLPFDSQGEALGTADASYRSSRHSQRNHRHVKAVRSNFRSLADGASCTSATVIAPLPLPNPNHDLGTGHCDGQQTSSAAAAFVGRGDDDDEDEDDQIGLSAEKESQGILNYGYTQEFLESVEDLGSLDTVRPPSTGARKSSVKSPSPSAGDDSGGPEDSRISTSGNLPASIAAVGAAAPLRSVFTLDSQASQGWVEAGLATAPPSQGQSQKRVSFTVDATRPQPEFAHVRKRAHSSVVGALALATLFSKKHRGSGGRLPQSVPAVSVESLRPPKAVRAAATAVAETYSAGDQQLGNALRLSPSFCPPAPSSFSLAHCGDLRMPRRHIAGESTLLFIPSVTNECSENLALLGSMPPAAERAPPSPIVAPVLSETGASTGMLVNLSMDSQEDDCHEGWEAPVAGAPAAVSSAAVSSGAASEAAVIHEQYATSSRSSTSSALGSLYGDVFFSNQHDVAGPMTPLTSNAGTTIATATGSIGSSTSIVTVYAGKQHRTCLGRAMIPEFDPQPCQSSGSNTQLRHRFALQGAIYACLLAHYFPSGGTSDGALREIADAGSRWAAMAAKVQECFHFLRHQTSLGQIYRLFHPPRARQLIRPDRRSACSLVRQIAELRHSLSLPAPEDCAARREISSMSATAQVHPKELPVEVIIMDDDGDTPPPSQAAHQNSSSSSSRSSSSGDVVAGRSSSGGSSGCNGSDRSARCRVQRLVLSPSFAPPKPRVVWAELVQTAREHGAWGVGGSSDNDSSSGGGHTSGGGDVVDPRRVLSALNRRRNVDEANDAAPRYDNQLFSNVIKSPQRTGQFARAPGAAGGKTGLLGLPAVNAVAPRNKALGMKLDIPVREDGGMLAPILLLDASVAASSSAGSVQSETLHEAPAMGTRSPPATDGGVSSTGDLSRKVIMSVEIFCSSRTTSALSSTHGSGGAAAQGTHTVFLTPAPKLDAIQALFYVIDDSVNDEGSNREVSRRHFGLITTATTTATAAAAIPPTLPPVDTSPEAKAMEAPLGAVNATATAAEPPRRRIQSCGIPSNTVHRTVADERALLLLFVDIVRRSDPDMIGGYEVQKSSLGYIIERGTERYGLKMLQLLSRMPTERESYMNTDGVDVYGGEHMSNIHLTGRIVLNVWRNMKEELKLYSYSVHSVAASLLDRRLPCFSQGQLTKWYTNVKFHHRVFFYIYTMAETNLLLLDKLDVVRRTSESARLYGIDFYSVMVRGSQYRVEAVLLKKSHKQGYLCPSPSKGKVARQSAMSVIPLVMEPNPSGYYSDPVVVLDFASLYPSMIIAYNLCYSTILGKLKIGAVTPSDSSAAAVDTSEPAVLDCTGRLGTENYPEAYSAMGSYYNTMNLGNGVTGANGFTPDPMNPFTSLSSEKSSPSEASPAPANAPPKTTPAPFLAPNGSLFCNKEVRLGVLPAMLEEILQARVTVKSAMKYYKSRARDGGCETDSADGSDVLGRVLDARQLAIKLLANVTYGYTAAGYSGRMPMAELADAVVQCGRTTLEWTMKVIQDGLAETDPDGNSNVDDDVDGWTGCGARKQKRQKYFGWSNARVIYGDTDSVFVHLPGRTKEEAFRIGAEISRYIGEASPANVTLKLEKVYLGCVMVTKKRYVGSSYETVDQKEPNFDAKGLECIRRDQCLATAKIQEKCLRMLFKTRGDLSQIKEYLCKEWYRIESGINNISLQDFIFSKAVKLGHYSSPSSYPPGATVALKNMVVDPYSYPVYKWRVPYVVVYGHSGTGANAAKLKDLVISPEELLRRNSTTVLTLNARYYIYKCINPALIRVFNICGADINSWYVNMTPHALTKQRRAVVYDDPGAVGLNTTALRGTAGTMGLTGARQPNQFVQSSILRYSSRYACDVCGETATPNPSLQVRGTLCTTCKDVNPPSMAHNALVTRLNALRVTDSALKRVCQNCVRHTSPQTAEYFRRGELLGSDCCQSIECPVFFKRFATVIRIEDIEYCM